MQYGFYFDQTRCIGCHACVVACKDRNDVRPGPVSYRKLHVTYVGDFPATAVYNTVYACNHCADPACVPACPYGAIKKEDEFGAVIIDRSKCQGSGACITACPYKAPQRADTGENVNPDYVQEPEKLTDWKVDHPAGKCDMCLARAKDGLQPACVAACPQRAVEWKPIDQLKTEHSFEYAETVDYDFPDPAQTRPSIIFKKRI